jgi:hypothetical protein
MSIEYLNLVGCNSAWSGSADTEVIRLLANARFSNLTWVEPNDYTVTSEQLIAFLRCIKTTTRRVYLKGIHLSIGTWSSVFQALRELEHLKVVWLESLTETWGHKSVSSIVDIADAGEEWLVKICCEVQEQMPEFLEMLIEGHVHLPAGEGARRGRRTLAFLKDNGFTGTRR